MGAYDDLKRERPLPQELYRHFKGKLYQIVTLAKHTETGEELVVYQALYGDFSLYARPLSMFLSSVDREKYPEAEQEFRFEKWNFEKWNKEAAKEPAPAPVEEEKQAQADLHLDPSLEAFLDAESYEERIRLLEGMRLRMTRDMLDIMEMSMDIPTAEESVEDRYQGLLSFLRARLRFESSRLR